MKQVIITLPTIEQVEFTLQCMPEDMPVRGNALASGNDAQDKEVEDSIIDQLENGNEWAWCTVQVTAKHKGIYGYDTLGACSYNDEKDFIQNSGYYQDMKKTAFNDLLTNLQALND